MCNGLLISLQQSINRNFSFIYPSGKYEMLENYIGKASNKDSRKFVSAHFPRILSQIQLLLVLKIKSRSNDNKEVYYFPFKTIDY